MLSLTSVWTYAEFSDSLQDPGVPEIMVYNKIDLLDPEHRAEGFGEHSVLISAVEGTGIPRLVEEISLALRRRAKVFELVVPYDRGDHTSHALSI